MSTLTKVFIVLLVTCSIAFSAMTISIVSQTANWRETAHKFEQHAQIADTNLRNLISANSAALAAAADKVRDHQTQIRELQASLQKASNEASTLRADLTRAASERSSSEAVQRGLAAQLEACGTARDEYLHQRDDLENSHVAVQRRNIDLNDRVNEQTAQIAVMLEQRRQYEQQINILRGENVRLSQAAGARAIGGGMEQPGGAGMRRVHPAGPVAAMAIRGSVIDVAGGVITLSVGGADGVREGMKFVIHRGAEYIGDIKISMVDPDRSAGRPIGAPFTPRRGDSVVDESTQSSRGG